jgi:hypothetical protein
MRSVEETAAESQNRERGSAGVLGSKHTKRAEQAPLLDSRDWSEEAAGKPRPSREADELPLFPEAR